MLNKKLIITQRPELLPERALSNHVNRLPLSREKDSQKGAEGWDMYHSAMFTQRPKAQFENRPMEHRYTSQQNPIQMSQKQQNQVDLLSLVSELAKINTETQERISQISAKVNRLEQSLNEFKGMYKCEMESKLEKSLEQLYEIINKDFKASQDNIIKHVCDVRDEVRSLTECRLEDIAKLNENRYNGLVQSLHTEFRKEVDKIKDGFELLKKKVEIQTVDLKEAIVDKTKFAMFQKVNIQCWAQSPDRNLYANLFDHLYYVTKDGHLTDSNGYVLIDGGGRPISIAQGHLQRLHQAGLLN